MLNEKQLNLCLEKIEDAAYVLDKEGKVKSCNDIFMKLIELNIDEVIGKKMNQLNMFSSESICQNNTMIMASEADSSSVLEFIKNKDNNSSELFQSQKKVLRDESGKAIGLLNVSKKYLPKENQNIVSLKTKHDLREVLNAFFGYNQKISYMANTYDAELAVKFKKIVDRLSHVVDKISVESMEDILLEEAKEHWCKVIWISDSIASFVFQPSANGLQVEKVDSTVALNRETSDKLFGTYYQIILVDESLLDLLPCDLQAVSESSLVIKVGEGKSENRELYLPEINYNRLINEYQTYLPQIWQSYICRKTVQRVNNNGVLRILSIEDNDDSQNALKQLLELYDFIETDFCSNAKSAQAMVSDYEFDLIILDLGLPDAPNKSGYDLALCIRNIQKQKGDFLCSIIANTGHESIPGISELFRRGVNELFRKPDLLRNLGSTLMAYVPKNFMTTCV